MDESDFLFGLNPEFKRQYRQAINKANRGDINALREANRLLKLLADRINAHLGDGMDKPIGLEKQTIF